MELKGRLGLIAEKIPSCKILCDVGTDHAYIPVYAVLNGICGKALATDLKKGPIEIAERNIKQYNLQNNIETRIGYGLDAVYGHEMDVVVIAGMGGILIQEILSQQLIKAKKAKLLILQPMNGIEILRKWLSENGFDITDEAMAAEGSKLYNVICSVWTGEKIQLDDFENYIGSKLINNSDPLLKEYLVKRLRQLEVIIAGNEKARQKSEDWESYVKMREKLLKLMNE